MRREIGFSLIELILVIGVLAIIVALVSPLVGRYIDDARTSRATNDVKVIGEAISRFFSHLGVAPGWTSGTALGSDGRALSPDDGFVDLLISDQGEMPVTSADWSLVGRSLGENVGYDSLENQLQTNVRGYATTGRFRWRGPYLEQIIEDPWAVKYLVNIEFAKPGAAANAVFVLSAGPDKTVNTAYAQSRSGTVTVSGDDIAFRLR